MITSSHKVKGSGSAHHKQIVALQRVTISWMCAEAAVAILAALRARSVVLLGFGVDSGIELASALVVFFRFQSGSRLSELKAARITGALLLALAVFVLGNSVLALTNPDFQPKPSYMGIALLTASAFGMPWLARKKRSFAARTDSGSLRADAAQSAMCGYLAWIGLAGLMLNAVFKIAWADPMAALLLLPIVVREGWEATQGKLCADCTGEHETRR